MKNYIILIMMFVCNLVSAQKETSLKRTKDTIKTEVINVVTSYAPKVTDAFKIKKKPVIKLSKEVQKKELSYQIVSVPVASTFVPKSGTLKGIDVGKRDIIFDNYLAVGFGNNITPFLEGFMHSVTRFDSEYGANIGFISSSDPVKNTELSSSFYNIDLGLFYKQEERYFDWTVGFNAQRNKYNWYGLPKNINYQIPTINAINEEQVYRYYAINGELEFSDSYIKNIKGAIGYFSDILENNEFHGDINTLLSFPIGRPGLNFEDIYLGASLNYLGGTFDKGYKNRAKKKFGYFNVGVNPYYKFLIHDFDIKIGGKAYFSMNLENKKNRITFYPDVSVSYPIIKKSANLYIGASGDLHQNSFRGFSEENPYISPTLDITQTNEMYNAFAGLKGIIQDKVNYNIKGSYKNEEDKPLFALQASKSKNGIDTGSITGFSYKGYEYGNSFNVLYDDVKTISAYSEVSYDYTKNVTLGLSGEFNKYTLKNQQQAWNLPTLKGEIFGKYKTDKWYAGINVYYIGDRKGIQHETTGFSEVDLKGYVDINVNGGYHFNPTLSVFLKVNNASNSEYQRFTNFNAQGIQAIGGVIWKFDSLF